MVEENILGEYNNYQKVDKVTKNYLDKMEGTVKTQRGKLTQICSCWRDFFFFFFCNLNFDVDSIKGQRKQIKFQDTDIESHRRLYSNKGPN